MTDYAANLAFFLQRETGSIYGKWSGNMPANQQRQLFGRFLGKGTLGIDGATERLTMTVKVCFGTDWDVRDNLTWAQL